VNEESHQRQANLLVTGGNPMNRTITLELPEGTFAALNKMAQESGTSPSEWIVNYLDKHLAPLHDEPVPDEARKARERFRRHFGEVNSGDPRSGDNDRIDADLAKAYADSTPKDA
jgi:hypothetical protein